jgi:hypothetical protein
MTTTIELLHDEWLPNPEIKRYEAIVERNVYFMWVTCYGVTVEQAMQQALAYAKAKNDSWDNPFPNGWSKCEPDFKVSRIVRDTITTP